MSRQHLDQQSNRRKFDSRMRLRRINRIGGTELRIQFSLPVLLGVLTWTPVAAAYAQEGASTGELFLGRTRLSGSAASSRFVCQGTCVVVTEREVRNHYSDMGWQASITGNFNRFAGIEFDVACCQKPGSLNTSQTTFLGGPRFTYRLNDRFHPFAHGLAGLVNGRQVAPVGNRTDWRPGFAAGFGGGLDVKAVGFVWVRAMQADYLRESFRDDVNKHWRLSFGIVLRFGSLLP